MIFSKKNHHDLGPKEAGPSRQRPSGEDGEDQLPEAWRVVLEDGSTSGDVSDCQADGAGRKLLAEMTEALSGRAARKGRTVRPRSAAMPSAPRQPLHALDHSLQCETAAPGGSGSGVDRRAAQHSGEEAVHSPLKLRARRCPGAKDASEVLSAQSGSVRRDLDARLARVIDLWPRLPRGIRAAILAMVEAEAAEAS